MMNRDSETHPSYGQVQFSRISGGGTRLYGSAVRKHGTSIVLRICQSELVHDTDTHTVWHHGRKTLIEVELTSAQFATLLTTMNMGDGVPCTIRRLGGESVESPPDDIPLEHERVGNALANDGKYAENINGSIDEALEAVETMLAGKSLRKGDLEVVRAKLRKAQQNVKANLPYVLTRFREAAEKVKTTVYAEADAWLTHAVQRAGLTALTGQAPQIEIDAPPAQIETDDDK